MADVFVTLSAPWNGHQIGDKIRVSEVEGRQLRRGGISTREPVKAAASPAKKAPAKKSAASPKPHAAKAADEKSSGDSA